MATPAFNIPGTTALAGADFKRRYSKDRPDTDYDALGGYSVRDALMRNAEFAAAYEEAANESIPTPAPKLRAVPTVDEEVASFNYVMDAANLMAAAFNLPEHLHYYACAVAGLVGQRTGFVSIRDENIAGRMACSTKTVARRRNEFDDWQQKQNVTLIDCLDHYTDKEGNRHAHQYKVLFSDLAVKVKRAAMARSDWNRNPGEAMREALKEFIDTVPTIPSKRKKKRRAPDLRDQINTNVKRAGNALGKAALHFAALQFKGYAADFEIDPEHMKAVEHNLSVLKGELNEEPILSSSINKELLDKKAPLPPFEPLVDISGGQIVHKNEINNLQAVEGGFDSFSDSLELSDKPPYEYDPEFGF